MALTLEFEEEYRTSRAISISTGSFQQDFVFYMCGNFLDEAIDDPTYGPDDDIVALAAAYTIVPPYRTMPVYAGGYIFLTLANLNVDQIGPETWKVSASYAPQGQDQDPAATGPAFEDRGEWSNNFVQLSFNVSSVQEQQSMSLQLVEIKKNVDFGNQNVPYTTGRRCPIGHTDEGVEGAPVYQRAFSFSITAYFPPASLTFAYVRRLYRLATTVNNASFFGFPPGSVLFLEASASGDLYSVVPVTFDFLMKPNYKFSSTGPDALIDPDNDDESTMYDVFYDPFFPSSDANTPYPGDAFSGWDIVDYRYLPTTDDTAKMALQKPVLRLMHNLYMRADFSKFNL